MDREDDRECRTGPRALAARCDVPVVRLDKCIGDGQADAGATMFAVACSICSVEALKNVWQVLGGDSVAVICHCDRDTALTGMGGDIDPAAGRSMTERVIEHVAQDLSKPLWVDPHNRQITAGLPSERNSLGGEAVRRCRDGGIDESLRRHGRGRDGSLAFLRLNQSCNVIRKTHQPAGLIAQHRDGFGIKVSDVVLDGLEVGLQDRHGRANLMCKITKQSSSGCLDRPEPTGHFG